MPSKLSRKSQPRNILIANLATSLILHGKARTTLPKAKLIQTYLEKIFTDVKDNSLSAKRNVGAKLKDKLAVAKLFDIAQKNISTLPGSGYTSIYKLNTRKGDGALMALIKIDESVFNIDEKSVTEDKKPNTENTEKGN